MSNRKCTVESCDRRYKCSGLCNMHYNRFLRHRDPLVTKRRPNGSYVGVTCSAIGCDTQAQSMGLCYVHYFRRKQLGHEDAQLKRRANGTRTLEQKREQLAEAQRRYRRTPHGKLRQSFNTAKRRALMSETGLLKSDFAPLLDRMDCGICGAPLDYDTPSVDHIVPLSKGGSNELANLQMAHLTCNNWKRAKTA